MAIDMHAHWVPRRLMSESKAGRDWYGWRILQDGAGREYASLGQHMLLFSASQGTLDDPMGRAKRREAEDGITFEALMLTGLFWNYHLPEDAAVRACREVNEEVAEVQRAYPDRFCGMALLPMQHQKAALAELEYASGKLNLRDDCDRQQRSQSQSRRAVGAACDRGGGEDGGVDMRPPDDLG